MHFQDEKSKTKKCPLIRYIPQDLNFDRTSPVSVLDFLVACQSRYPVWLPIPGKLRKKMKENLEVVKVEHLIDHRLGSLSGGELQRVLLAIALHPIPDLLLLDEPTSGIDPNGIKLFFKTISSLRKNFDLSVIMVSHDLGWIADFADYVVLLNQTIQSQGTPAQVYSSQNFRDIFGLSFNQTSRKKAQ
jgi:zinc transport system ATP-binding protein